MSTFFLTPSPDGAILRLVPADGSGLRSRLSTRRRASPRRDIGDAAGSRQLIRSTGDRPHFRDDAIIAHEAHHAAWITMNERGMSADTFAGDAGAYYVEWIVNQIHRALVRRKT